MTSNSAIMSVCIFSYNYICDFNYLHFLFLYTLY